MTRTGEIDFSNLLFRNPIRLILLHVLFCLTAIGGVHASEAEQAKRVLIVSTGSTFAPGFTLAAQTATDTLRQLETDPLELYTESLDIVRFPSDSYSRLFRNYLGEKYLDYPPDLPREALPRQRL